MLVAVSPASPAPQHVARPDRFGAAAHRGSPFSRARMLRLRPELTGSVANQLSQLLLHGTSACHPSSRTATTWRSKRVADPRRYRYVTLAP